MGEGRSSGLVAQAAKRIRGLIVHRKLKPGEIIGTEAELASSMAVSRNVVREAVGQLRGLRLVNSCQCKGLIVAQPDPAETFRVLIPHYVVDGSTFAELADLRFVVEVGAVDLAVQRGTDAEMARLLRLAEEMDGTTDDGRRLDALEVRFHKSILLMTKNSLLQGLHFVIASFFRRAARELPSWNQKPWTPCEHLPMARALADRNVELSRTLLAAHLRQYVEGKPPPRRDRRSAGPGRGRSATKGTVRRG